MTYRDIINYLTQIATDHTVITDSYHGDYREILKAELSDIDYPLLWIESPSAKIKGDPDSKVVVYDCAVVVLISNPDDTFDVANTNIDTAQAVAMDIISKLIKDYNDGTILGIDLDSINLDLVWSENNDNGQGWRITFTIDTKDSRLCYDPARWN